jgi:pyrroloquinoline-quinone synthase
VSAVHSLCEDEAARPGLAHNLADEEGVANGGGEPHPELWLRFAEGLGVSRDAVRAQPAEGAAQALRDGFLALTRSSYAEGLGALVAYEHQIPAIARTKIEGLEKHYGVTDARALEFFRVHETADMYHSGACLEALDRLSPENQERAGAAARRAADLLWDFLTEAYAAA